MSGHSPTSQYHQSVSLPYQNQDNSCIYYQNHQRQFEVESLPPSNYTQNEYCNDSVYSIPPFLMDTSHQHQNYNQKSYNQHSPPGQFFSCQDFSHRAEGTQITPANDTKCILDLDTHENVLYSEDEKRQNGDSYSDTPKSNTFLIDNWNQDSQIRNQDIHSFQNNLYEKLYTQTDLSSNSEQESFQLHPIATQEYKGNVVPSTQEPQPQTTSYKASECLQPQTFPTVIPNSEVPSAPTQAAIPTVKCRMYDEIKRPKIYNCSSCNKSFTTLGHLKRHHEKTLHENAVAPLLMQDMAVKSLNSTIDLHFNSVDSSRAAKQPYERVHNKSSPTITIESKRDVIHCYECNKTFKTKAYLKQHENYCHSVSKPYKCTHCGKRFHSENLCKQHHKKHFGEKPYKCEICSKQFNYRNDLRRHMYLHNGDKPYTCETCKKGFVRKDHMMKHCATHNRQRGRNAFHAANED